MPNTSDSAKNSRYESYYTDAMDDYPLPSKLFFGLVIVVVYVVTKIFWNWKLEDKEKLYSDSVGKMVIMNHVSVLDPIVVVTTAWFHGKHLRPIYKSEFDKIGIFSWFLARAGAIPVKRGTADMSAVRRARAALERGESVLVFPEGTRIKSDDEEVTIHAGFALMAQLAQAPVLPVAIVGARDIRPRGKMLPRLFVRVFSKVGDELGFEGLSHLKRKEQASEMEKLAMDKVYEIRDELRHAHPGKM